jgi:diguanylate cyclase (GGDEF)-like protein
VVSRADTNPVSPENCSIAPRFAGRSVVAVCAGLLVLVTGLRFVVDNPIEAVGFLYVLPISLAAVEFGWRGGVAAAYGAMACTIFWALAQDVPLGAVGYTVRGSMFAGLAVLVGLQSDQRRSLLEERDRLVDELRGGALRDQLTGLANRRAWDGRFAQELQRASRSGMPLSVAVMDIDGLKRINDTFGHAEGDRLIQRAAAAWQLALRDVDFIARLGGDEFFVLLPDCCGHKDEDVARRLVDAVDGYPSVSIGVAAWKGEAGDLLVARADRAMYEAKAAGGARIVVAGDPALAGPVAERRAVSWTPSP